jgi:hypothetical protein
MWRWRKFDACWYIAFCNLICVSDVVGRSRIRFAAKSYFPKESISRFRTFDASANCVCEGGLSGSCSIGSVRWKLANNGRMPLSNCKRFSYDLWTWGLWDNSASKSFLLKIVVLQSRHILISKLTLPGGFSARYLVSKAKKSLKKGGVGQHTRSNVQANFSGACCPWISTHNSPAYPTVMPPKRPRPEFLLAEWTFCYFSVFLPCNHSLLESFSWIISTA